MEGLKLDFAYDKYESKSSNDCDVIIPKKFVEIKNKNIYFFSHLNKLNTNYLEIQNNQNKILSCVLKESEKPRKFNDFMNNDKNTFFINEKEFFLQPNECKKIFICFLSKNAGCFSIEIKLFIYSKFEETINLNGYAFSEDPNIEK